MSGNPISASNTSHFDVIVVGGGPAGYTAAEQAGAAGLKVLLIERDYLGGTCLNHGCIPTKTLLASGKLFASLKTAHKFGVQIPGDPVFDYLTAKARVERIVASLRSGVAYQMDRRGVQIINGEATILDRRTVQVNTTQDAHRDAQPAATRYTCEHLILATGAYFRTLDLLGVDLPHVVPINHVFGVNGITQLPRKVVILGADALAFGMAAIFTLLGVSVDLVTPDDTVLPEIDAEIVAAVLIEVKPARLHLQTHVVEITPDQVVVEEAGERIMLTADLIIVSAGRIPNLDGLHVLDLDTTGGSGGAIRVDDQMRTNLPNVYAIGDVTGRAQWAHAAHRAAQVAVHTVQNVPDTMRWNMVPSLVYTYPEVASIGLTEAAARVANLPYRIARLPMVANGRFVTDTEGRRGLAKFIIETRTNRLIGAHILAPNASELIFGAATMLEMELSTDDITQIIYAHPTTSEIFKDALLGGS